MLETDVKTALAKRLFMFATAIVLAIGFHGATFCFAAAAAPDDRPNIIFIMADDLGSADLGCYGGESIQTPRLDRMAAEGMKFTRAYAGCTVCAPSRSTLLTGYHMGHTAVRGNTGGVALAADDVTIAEVLKKAGYATGGFGKWGVGEVDTPGVPEKHGFDEFLGNYHQIHAHYFYTDYLYLNGRRFPLPGNEGFYRAGRREGPIPAVDPETGKRLQYAHAVMFDRMMDFIREHRDEPFFCYAPWNPPHGRFEIPEDDPAWALYRDKPWPMNARVAAAMTTMIDRQVGEVFDLLEQLGLDSKTIVFFCSDNGGYEGVGGPLRRNGSLRGGKRQLYEGGLRVPLLVRWPGRVAAGSVSALPTYFPDVMPTLAELAGAGRFTPDDIDGLSIVPTLLGAEAAGREQKRHEYLYWEYMPYEWGRNRYRPGGPMQAVRWSHWKAVRDFTDAPIELYDLDADPAESRDLAARHPDFIEKAKAWMTEAHTEPRPQIEPERIGGRPYR